MKSSQIAVDEGIIPKLPTMNLTTKTMITLPDHTTKLIPSSSYQSRETLSAPKYQFKSIGFYYCRDANEPKFWYLLCKKTMNNNFMK